MKTFSTEVRNETRIPSPCPLCGGDSFIPRYGCGGFSFVTCGSCRLVQQNPKPTAREVESRYGSSYLSYQLEHEKAFLELELKALGSVGFDRFCIAGKRRFLDVGCSTGALLEAVRKRGWSVAGVEICPDTASYGIEKRDLDISISTLEDARFGDASFDCIHASHLIEHLSDPASFVRECARLLAEGGILCVTTPNVDGFQSRIAGSAWRSAIYDHLFLFSRRTLSCLLERNGFAILETRTWGGWALGSKPAFLKPLLDRAVKPLGAGDVMIMTATRS